MINWFKKLFRKKSENLKDEKKTGGIKRHVQVEEGARVRIGTVTITEAQTKIRQSINQASIRRANDKMILAGLEARRLGRYIPPAPPKRVYPTAAPQPTMPVTVYETGTNDDGFFTALAVASLLNDEWQETKRTPVEDTFTTGRGGEFGGGGASGSWAPESPAYIAPYVPPYEPPPAYEPPAPAPSYYSPPPSYESPAPSPSYDWSSSSSSSDSSSSSSDSSSSWSSSD